MVFTKRQEDIINIVKKYQPINGDNIAKKLSLTRSALRTDFSILTKSGILKAKTKVGYFYQGIGQKKFVRDIMTSPVNIDENASIQDAISKLYLKNVGNLFITNNKKLIGIVSRKDLLRAAIGNMDVSQIPVSVIMTRMPNLVFCEENDEIIEAVKKIVNHQVDCLPVVRTEINKGVKSFHVVGRISKTHITNLFLEFFDR